MSTYKPSQEIIELISHSILSNTSEAIYYKDLESKFIAVNQYQLDYFGLTSMDEIIGTSDFDYFTREHALHAYNDEQEIIRTGNPKLGIVEQETWTNSEVSYVVTSKYPLYNDNQDIIGTWGHSINIAVANNNNGLLKKHLITREEVIEELNEDSKTDTLTGLPNLKAFYEFMNLFYQKALNAMNMPDKDHVLALIDMNGFGNINADYGVEYGDQALIFAAKLISEYSTDNISLFRYSGDKFALLIENMAYDEAVELCESILKQFKNHNLEYKEATIGLIASIGVSRFKDSLPFGNIHDVINITDRRLYAAKASGKPTIVYDNSFTIS